jgi:ectoine hydroxylase-related dioxygenase (phytanoyl-CoA dioxygenase family)
MRLNRSAMLSDEQRMQFERDGFCVIRQFHDVEKEILPIQRAIYEIIDLVAKRHGETLVREPFRGENFDSGYSGLIAKNRAYGAEVYDLVKQIPAFLRLICSPVSEQLFSELRGSGFPGIGAASYGIRIDNPAEEQYRSNWHQEFLYQPQSIDGVVFWTPLVRMTPDIGPVIICAGSHKDGLCLYSKSAYGSKSGAYKVGIHQVEQVVARYKQVAPLSEPGDLILMDFLTIHQSGFNASNRSRWSVQSRFFNFQDPMGMKVGWKASVTAGTDIEAIFPENFV